MAMNGRAFTAMQELQVVPIESFPVPARSLDAVCRAAVTALLDSATGRCALVCATGGYGKTTQVGAWAARDSRPVVWIDLECCDNDPTVLLPGLARALRNVTDVDADAMAQIERHARGPSAQVASLFGRAVGRTVEPFVLVLDDLDVISETGSLDVLGSLLHHIPPWSTLVLIGRSEPALPLARVRAEDGLVQIGTADLALDVPAAESVLRSLGVHLDEADVARIVEATEGWAVGIRTAGLALRDAGDADAAAAVIDAIGHDQFVAEYVREEWLRGLSTADVDFLTQVSVFDHLDGPACDWVLDRSDSGQRLEELYRTCAGALPLNRRSGIYRMHALLRDALDQSFERSSRLDRRRLDLRASEWFTRTGEIDRAVRHAFRAGDAQLAERLVYDHALSYHTRGQYITVNSWLSSFTAAQVLASPQLCLIASVTELGLGHDTDAEAWTRRGIGALPNASDVQPNVAHELAVIRAVLSTEENRPSIADITVAYDALPAGPWHAASCEILGSLHFSAGDDALALAILHEGATEAHLVGAATIESICLAHLAVIHLEAGDREKAAAAAREARHVVHTQQLDEMPTLILVTAMSALVEAIDGHVDRAKADLLLTRRSMPYVSAVGSWANVQARIALAHTCLLLSDHAGARILLDEAEHYLRDRPHATRVVSQIAALVQQLRHSSAVLPAGPLSLTPAEQRVLHFLPTNLTIANIAERLYVSRNTAKAHAAAVYRKLGVASRGQAVAAARDAGLLADLRSS